MTRREERIEGAVKKGLEAARNSFNCAQGTLAGLMREFLPDDPALETLISAAYPFASGGCRGDTCGCVSGALIFLGYLYYKDDTKTPFGMLKQPAVTEPSRGYGIATDYVDRFQARWGDVLCRKVHPQIVGREFDLADHDDAMRFFMAGGNEKCGAVIGYAIRTVCDMILDEDGNIKQL